MRSLLVGVNARDIHANPALYSLARYAAERGADEGLELREYALHTPTQYILADIYACRPELLGFSMYIWNAQMILALLTDLKKLLPETKIILGGPEASARAAYYLRITGADAVCVGEGEESFCALLQALRQQEVKLRGAETLRPSGRLDAPCCVSAPRQATSLPLSRCLAWHANPSRWGPLEFWRKISGWMAVRRRERVVGLLARGGKPSDAADFPPKPQGLDSPELKAELPAVDGFMRRGHEDDLRPAEPPDMAELPFLYDERIAAMLGEKHKLVYYESSRGCPFSCSFCASAAEPLRERPLDTVLAELPLLAAMGGQIKFIDRTFNADEQRAIIISQAILELARPGLSWHFEVSPFMLTPRLIRLWNSAPAGYLHLELGVQTLYPPALAAVGRRGDWDKAEPRVKELIAAHRCHVHLDLIAGLPMDTPAGFAASFHRLHQLAPDYLQFGFLKLLPGSYLQRQAAELGLVYGEQPPYQILYTPDMPAPYLFSLHRAERVFNTLYNKTHSYRDILIAAAQRGGDALGLYLRAAALAPAGRGLEPREIERIITAIRQEN